MATLNVPQHRHGSGPLRSARPAALFTAAMLAAMSLAPLPVAAQGTSATEADVRRAIEATRSDQPNLRFSIDERTGLPTRIRNLKLLPDPEAAVRALRSSSGGPTEADIKLAVEAFFESSSLRSAFPQRTANAKRIVEDVRPDPSITGSYVATVRQEVVTGSGQSEERIPVFGSSAKVTVDQGLAVTSLTASLSPVDVANTEIIVSPDDAVSTARTKLLALMRQRSRQSYAGVPAADIEIIEQAEPTYSKVIFDPKIIAKRDTEIGPARIAWLILFDTYRVFIDAQTREFLYFYKDYRSAAMRRVLDFAGRFENETLVLDEASGKRNGSAGGDVGHAFRNAGLIRDYYFKMFGRRGFDDEDGPGPKSGSDIVLYVGYGNQPGARWCPLETSGCPQGNAAVFGPGFAASLDVTAHEFTHGVIAHEANLIYADESGAVNEAMADIFGALVELWALGPSGNWLIGETLPERSVKNPERDMANPHLVDDAGQPMFTATLPYDPDRNRGQPAVYSERLTRSDPLCESTSDFFNNCVHFNSGILNRFAYLAANGPGDGARGIGTERLAVIAYRALTTKMTESSGLIDAAEAFIDACFELAAAKVESVTEADCQILNGAAATVELQRATG